MLLLVIAQHLTFPHEGALVVVHYLLRDERIVDHVVIFHGVEAALLHTAVDLILLQRTLHESAEPLYGSMYVLTAGR